MRKLLWIIFVVTLLAAGLLFGHALIGEKGYVLIALGNTTIEMSVISALLSLFVILIGVRIIEWLGKWILSSFSRSRSWLGSFSQRKQRKAYYGAINAMSIGDLAGAKTLIERTYSGEFGGSNYILAADIQAKLGHKDAVVPLLELAQSYPESQVCAQIRLAAWRSQQEQYKQAIEHLETLPAKAQQNKQVAQLWLNALAKSKQFDELKNQLAQFKKVLGSDYLEWAQTAIQGEFSEIASKQGANAVKQKWQNLSRAARKDLANQIVYVQTLLDQGLHKDAEEVIVDLNPRHLDPAYFGLAKQVSHPSPTALIRLVERSIKAQNENASLYSVLANVALNCNDISLANKAINKALELASDPDDAKLKALLLEKQQQFEEANRVYQHLLS